MSNLIGLKRMSRKNDPGSWLWNQTLLGEKNKMSFANLVMIVKWVTAIKSWLSYREKLNLLVPGMVSSGYQFPRYRRITQNYSKMLHHIQKDTCQAKDSHHSSLSKSMPTRSANMISDAFITLGFKAAFFYVGISVPPFHLYWAKDKGSESWSPMLDYS